MKLPEGWEETELGNVFDFQSKTGKLAGSGLETGKYKFFTSSEIQKVFTDEHDFEGEHLIFATGGKAGLHYCNEKFSTSNDCFVVKVSNPILTRYAYYFLRAKIHLLEAGFKGAGLRHISKGYIQKLKIIYPKDKQIQKLIVSVLEKVESTKNWREEVDKLTNSMLKSIFLEKFCSTRADSWKEIPIKDLALPKKNSMRTGPFGSNLRHGEFVNNGIAVLGIDNAVDNYFNWKVRRFITKQKYEKLKQYTVYPRDVIITIMATVGRSAVVPSDIPLAINTKHLAAITFDEKKANPYFISYSIHSNPHILSQIKLKNRGAIMPGLNLGIIKEFKIKIPPVELQNEFEKEYHNLRAMKNLGRNSKEQIDNLFNILMQKAFKGELIHGS